MEALFSYQSSFTLTRSYFAECYAQSVVIDYSLSAYRKACAFIIVGMALIFFTELNRYLASFIVGLGIVEALSVRYQQAWWVTRQMLSRAANAEVALVVNEQGVEASSVAVNFMINWDEVEAVTTTELGILLTAKGQKHYISNSVLSDEALIYIKQKVSNND